MHERTALVTGAARGIGLAVVQAFLEAGARVIAIDRDVSNSGIAHIDSGFERLFIAQADVMKKGEVHKVLTKAEKHVGPVDILVNNAGISPKLPDGRAAGLLETSDELLERVIQVNLAGALAITQMVIPHMVQQRWGRVINISSLAGRTKAAVAGPAYMMSKAGLLGLTRSIAMEYGPVGLTANCVAPGRIDSDMVREAGEAANARFIAATPIKRLGTPQEIAAAVVFLASQDAGFINGGVIDVNGGVYMA